MNRKEQSKKEFFKEWLEKLQQESWQLELLISGFAILGLVQSKPLLFSFVKSFSIGGSIATIPLVIVSYAIIFGWYIFIVNLIIHILVRGLWIGAVGLRYVSGDIDYDKLRYSEHFTNFFKKKVGSFDNYIERLEKLASVLFAYTFLLFFMVISVLCFFSIFMGVIIFLAYLGNGFELPSENINIDHPVANIALLGFLLISIIVLIDFLGLGFLKRVKQRHFAKFYFIVFRIFSFLTFSHIWRPLLLNFLDTKYTKRLFLLALPYGFVIAFILPSVENLKHEYYPTFERGRHKFSTIVNQHTYHFQYYDDDRKRMNKPVEQQDISSISIPSKKVSGNFLELFIKAHRDDHLLIKAEGTEISPLSKKGLISSRFDSRQFERVALEQDSTTSETEELEEQKFTQDIIDIKRILSDAVRIKIDDIEINNDSIAYDFYLHPDYEDKGLLAYIPISHLNIGRHTIYVSKKIGDSIKDGVVSVDSIEVKIPFLLD